MELGGEARKHSTVLPFLLLPNLTLGRRREKTKQNRTKQNKTKTSGAALMGFCRARPAGSPASQSRTAAIADPRTDPAGGDRVGFRGALRNPAGGGGGEAAAGPGTRGRCARSPAPLLPPGAPLGPAEAGAREHRRGARGGSAQRPWPPRERGCRAEQGQWVSRRPS